MLVLGLPQAARAQAQACVPVATADWMVAGNPLAARVRPADCAFVTQTPPDFGWPDASTDAKYQVTLTYPDGHTKTVPALINWLNWPEVLPAGYYSWQVQLTNSAGTKMSAVRHFTVDSAAKTFLVPDGATLYSRVVAKPHPRALPDATTLATMASQRQVGLNALLTGANYTVGVAPLAPTTIGLIHEECKRATLVALAYVFTKQQKYLTDAIVRVKTLASWDPNGSTNYSLPGMDMAGREITWTLALLYDWLWPQLDATTRAKALSSLQTRTAAMYNDVIGTRSRLARSPLDSHGQLTVTILAATAAILAGDTSAAQTWLTGTMPQAINVVSPWGDDDSGHGNGSTQGSWDMGDSLVPWYVLRWTTGIDIAQKAWMRNWSNFIAYFIPPGTPTGHFGDGAEYVAKENWARFGKAATWFAPTPLGRWYASQLSGEDAARIEVMLAPPADYTTASFPAGTPNTRVFRGIGWAAMHSDLSNPARTSVYFKSSPYGSFNHSHADQNSFVIDAGGQRLAIDSGYYDGYKTAHWKQWAKQTRAHNAITYDGGIGQVIFEDAYTNTGPGMITRYTHGSDHEIVYGDATASYAGALTKARRALVYLPPNLVLVYDDLASNTARQWEWNIHAVNQIASSSSRSAAIQSGTQKLCVDVLGGPTTVFSQTNAFTANPTGTWSPQWHGKFYNTTKATSAEFVTLLNVGCVASTTAPSATKSGSAWTVKVAGKTLTIDGGNVTVGGATTTVPPPPPPPPPPTTTPSTPYTGTPINVPATFEAENFDKGGEGLAYHDTSKGNVGAVYRTAEDVDLIASCDPAGGGYVVNNFTTGEWLAYTINVPTSGRYDIAIKASNNYATGAFHAEIDGVNVTGSITPLKTGSWCTFQWFGKTGVTLAAGKHVLKVFADQQYFNVNSVRVTVSP